MCGIGVVKDWEKLRRFNLMQIQDVKEQMRGEDTVLTINRSTKDKAEDSGATVTPAVDVKTVQDAEAVHDTIPSTEQDIPTEAKEEGCKAEDCVAAVTASTSVQPQPDVDLVREPAPLTAPGIPAQDIESGEHESRP